MAKLELSAKGTLYNDESVHKKLLVMSKWEAFGDDERNTEGCWNMEDRINEFMQLGKSYKVTLIVEEVCENTTQN